MGRLIISCLLWLAVLAEAAVAATPAPVGLFDGHDDVGPPGRPGAARHDPAGNSYLITGGGADISGSADAFHYAWTRGSGDLHVSADIAWVAGSDPERKAGLMIRQSLAPGAPYAAIIVDGDGRTALQFREIEAGPTRRIVAGMTAPAAVRLEREGDYVFFSLAGADGVMRHAGGGARIAFRAPYLVGLVVSAHDDAATSSAVFSDVRLAVPTLAYVPDTGYAAAVESTLEVIETGGEQTRRIVRHFDGKIEAPNWSRDGASLIYNGGGLIYRIPVAGGEPVAIATGRHRRNNNDHGISPDGTQLIISDQSNPDHLSRIYLLPLVGSDRPRLVVGHPDTPSYWHGWSPDGRTIAYTATRPGAAGDFDIYARDLAGGAERRLTATVGVDDGAEYSPDGRHLYFNSARTGAMQLWRARAADGAGPEQVTHDPDYRDWFPHLSPDGRWIVFPSFGLDIEVGDHPPNRDVTLRIMPADGSRPPRVLARLFGGQGTINVPSWSPDGTRVAFVSYRLVR